MEGVLFPRTTCLSPSSTRQVRHRPGRCARLLPMACHGATTVTARANLPDLDPLYGLEPGVIWTEQAQQESDPWSFVGWALRKGSWRPWLEAKKQEKEVRSNIPLYSLHVARSRLEAWTCNYTNLKTASNLIAMASTHGSFFFSKLIASLTHPRCNNMLLHAKLLPRPRSASLQCN